MGAILSSLGQVFTADFWGRILTRPHEAVIRDPLLALKSAAGGAAATLAVAGAVVAAPTVATVLGGLFTAGKVVAAPVAFAAKHPVLSYVLATQSDLPTEIVRTFGQIYGQTSTAPGAAPIPAPVLQPVPAAPQVTPGVSPQMRGPVPGVQAQWNAMLLW